MNGNERTGEESGPGAVARAAMTAVMAKDRSGWLDLFDSGARVEDPVGAAPAIEGRAGLEGFWDNGIASLREITFTVERLHEAGPEAVAVVSVELAADGGATAGYDGVFHYTVDDSSRIRSLRAFWDLTAVAEQLSAS